MLFFGVFLLEAARTVARSRTNLSTANGPIGPEVASPSVFHGHNFIETFQVAIIAGSSPEISQTVRINCRSFLSRVPGVYAESRRAVLKTGYCVPGRALVT